LKCSIDNKKNKIFSNRFQTFADLFIRCPLAIQTQHPGFYYQESAYQSMARKQLAQTTCRRIEQADFDSSEFLKPTEFYGQRPWRQHHQSKLSGTKAKDIKILRISIRIRKV
jgi:hypothetical protein